MALTESEICPEIPDEKFPINGYLEADYFVAGGTSTLCFCGLIGNFREKIGDVVRAPEASRWSERISRWKFSANEISMPCGRWTVKFPIAVQPGAGQRSGESEIRLRQLDRRLRRADISSCRRTHRGPDGLEIFDTEFPENTPFAGRPTKIKISGVGLATASCSPRLHSVKF